MFLSALAFVFVLHSVSAQVPAESCNVTACKLPDCLCASTNPPGNLPVNSIPQIVTINFDDAFRRFDYEAYYSAIFKSRKNPNDCPIGLTFFNSHRNTDYSLVEHAHFEDGYEFASHSVTHRVPTTWWEDATENELKDEIVGTREILSKWAAIPNDRVLGYRGPFLVTSENQLKVLHDNNFLYDSSMSSATGYWPFTLDYKSPLCTPPATCPEFSYPGLWVVPHKFYVQENGFTCSMIDACTQPFLEDEWYNFLVDNFMSNYNSNRSPFAIHAHSAWFFGFTWRVNAMNRFLDFLEGLGNVYIVTQTKMLDWVRNPTPISQLNNFQPWQCDETPATSRCDFRFPSCSKVFSTDAGLANFKSCTEPCPLNFPDLGNTEGL